MGNQVSSPILKVPRFLLDKDIELLQFETIALKDSAKLLTMGIEQLFGPEEERERRKRSNQWPQG